MKNKEEYPKKEWNFIRNSSLWIKNIKPGNKAVKKRFEQLLGMGRTKPSQAKNQIS